MLWKKKVQTAKAGLIAYKGSGSEQSKTLLLYLATVNELWERNGFVKLLYLYCVFFFFRLLPLRRPFNCRTAAVTRIFQLIAIQSAQPGRHQYTCPVWFLFFFAPHIHLCFMLSGFYLLLFLVPTSCRDSFILQLWQSFSQHQVRQSWVMPPAEILLTKSHLFFIYSHISSCLLPGNK